MRDLYDTLANEYGDLSKEQLRRIALELIYAIHHNNTKWDYIQTMNEAIENINENLFLEDDERFTEKEIN